MTDLPRSSGVLLHPTCLPSPFGVGDLGTGARDFIDRLQVTQQRWWQILPLNPPAFGNVPYTATSAFAGNTMLIDPLELLERNLIAPDDLDDLREQARADHYDIGPVDQAKHALIERAWSNWREQGRPGKKDFKSFRKQNKAWLEDYALFVALKQDAQGADWRSWDDALTARDPKALAAARERLEDRVELVEFAQWVFLRQWEKLRAYAAERDVQFIGDVPIFVAMDSADVWANRELFLVSRDGQADRVAGVPPDYFSETGQKWGNPLFDWEAIADRDFDWWIARMEHCCRMVDLVRIDHFRGFESFWAVPAEAPDARKGEWRQGPGDAFFEALREQLGEIPVIAEDLGIITDGVRALRDRWKLPGMRIMQFAFGDDNPDHIFRPHTYPPRCVAYTGTHDNDTTQGWYDQADELTRHRVRSYLSHPDEGIVWAMIESLWSSDAALVLVPLQDLFEMGTEARFNTPGTTDGNWVWRAGEELIEEDDSWDHLARITSENGREA